jgi:hypothetical protein
MNTRPEFGSLPSGMSIEKAGFKELDEYYGAIVGPICEEVHGRDYIFWSVEDVENLATKGKVAETNKIICTEILERAHWVATTAIGRHRMWTSGIQVVASTGNLLAYAACMRGFIESAADVFDALGNVPQSLADHFGIFRKGIEGKLADGLIVAPEIEDTLIHFTHGRKLRKNEQAPSSHRAKSTREYVETLTEAARAIGKDKSVAVSEFYSLLCELTHPSYLSVVVFTNVTEDGSRVRLDFKPEMQAVQQMESHYRVLFPPIFQLSLNPCVMTLKVLNHFPLPAVHTKALDSVALEMPGWLKIAGKLQ